MAKQRVINTKFWDDNYIVSLNAEEKLVFLYLLTNPLTNIAGCYEIGLSRIAFDTTIPAVTIMKIFEKFSEAGKVTYRDGWVVIHNFIKNQANNPKVKIGIEEAVKCCPDWVKDAYSIGFDSLSHLNLNSNLNSNLSDIAAAAANETAGDRKKAEKKTLLPEDFSISADMREWASREAPDINPDDGLAEFKTFWIDIATKNNKRTYRGWVATWQNRMRDLQEKRFGPVKKSSNGHKPAWQIAIENCPKCDDKGYVRIDGKMTGCDHK